MAYLVAAWLLVEVSSVVLPALRVPDQALTYVVVAAMAGFPITLLLAWLFDVTPDGIVRTSSAAESPEAVNHLARRGIGVIVVAVFLGIIGFVVFDSGRFGAGDGDRSIAVLPFEDLSEGGANEYFSDGLSEEVLNSLVGVDGLRVAARTSSWAFKNRNVDVRRIAEQLDVDTVLEGSVRKDGDRVRIAAKLINADNGFQIWSKTYERPFDDIFAIQDEIARSIVGQLELELAGGAGAGDPPPAVADIGAWDLYLKGRHQWHQRTAESLQRAKSLFEESIAQDPGFALAYTGLADTYLLLDGYGDLTSEEAVGQAEPLVARALSLDSGLAEAYASLGLLRLNQGNLDAAELALRQAVNLNPGYSMAHMWLGLALMETTGPAAALEEFRAARRPDPLHPAIAVNTAEALAATGDYAGATGVIETVATALGPMPDQERERFLDLMLARLQFVYGHYDQTVQTARVVRDRGTDPAKAAVMLAQVWLALGDPARARAELDSLEDAGEAGPWVELLRVLIWDAEDCRSCLEDYLAARTGEGAGPEDPAESAAPGMAAYAAEDWARADRWLTEAAGWKGKGPGPADRALMYSLAADARHRLGDSAGAEEALGRAGSVLAQARLAGWRMPQITAAEALIELQQGRAESGGVRLEEAIGEGWREYWLLAGHPAFQGLSPDSPAAAALERVRRELEVMLAAVTDGPPRLASMDESR